MKWFPSGGQTALDTDIEAQRIREAGKHLQSVHADVYVLQEIRSTEVTQALAAACGPEYDMVVCSNFRDGFGATTSWQQLAIISRLPAKAAWAEDWKTVGKTDPPRGFVFAAFEVDGRLVGCYGVHLKSNLRSEDPRTNQLNILKRELAINQLLRHRDAVDTRLNEKVDVWIVAGDFNTTLDDTRFASESTLRSLLESGFTLAYQDSNPATRWTVPAYHGYPPATFDYIFVSGASWLKGAAAVDSPLSDHRLVFGSINLSAP